MRAPRVGNVLINVLMGLSDALLQAAEESIVLLANGASPPLLPLRPDGPRGSAHGRPLKVGVMGPMADDPFVMMGGKARRSNCPKLYPPHRRSRGRSLAHGV